MSVAASFFANRPIHFSDTDHTVVHRPHKLPFHFECVCVKFLVFPLTSQVQITRENVFFFIFCPCAHFLVDQWVSSRTKWNSLHFSSVDQTSPSQSIWPSSSQVCLVNHCPSPHFFCFFILLTPAQSNKYIAISAHHHHHPHVCSSDRPIEANLIAPALSSIESFVQLKT